MVPPAGYLAGVRALCDKYGILYIADEVMAGFGRTGAWFAFQHFGITPDLVTFAKGVNSGYVPLGGVIINQAVSATFGDRVYPGGLTYSGHPLACAAAVGSMRFMSEAHVIEHAKTLGDEIIRPELLAMQERHPSIGEIRGLGVMFAIELVKDRATKEPLAPYNSSSPAMAEIGKYLKEQGLYVFLAWNLVHVNPPLVTSAQQINDIFAVIDKALDIGDKHYTGKK
jgi:taurine--2-oxoglutarate transaminase